MTRRFQGQRINKFCSENARNERHPNAEGKNRNARHPHRDRELRTRHPTPGADDRKQRRDADPKLESEPKPRGGRVFLVLPSFSGKHRPRAWEHESSEPRRQKGHPNLWVSLSIDRGSGIFFIFCFSKASTGTICQVPLAARHSLAQSAIAWPRLPARLAWKRRLR